jgi:hypothetical protein
METHRIPVQPLSAEFAAAQANREERTVPMTFYAGATVLQFDWESGVHELTLSMDSGACRLGALKSGRAPFTLGHASPNDPLATLGVILNPAIAEGKATADVRFSKRADVEPVYQDVLDEILCNVSVGAKLLKLKETTKDGDRMRSFLATSWEPFAVALVGVGADPGACFKAAAGEVDVECEIEFAGRASSPQEQVMEETKPGQGGGAPAGVSHEQAIQAALAAEESRVQEINKIVGLGKLDAAFALQHITSKTSIEQFREVAFARLAERSAAGAPTQGHHATLTVDERDKVRLAGGQVVMNLFDRKNVVDSANDMRGMSVLRLAEELLHRTGRAEKGMSKARIAELSMHNTADFPYILADSARKQMLAAYALATPTYRIWAKPSTSPDFKTMSRLRLSEAPTFLKVNEGAQITLGTMSESREQYALLTAGRGASFTRQMMINDDVGAFLDLLNAFGFQAARYENKTVYAILTANAAMSDSVALFHATHANLGSGAIGNTGLDAMFSAMAIQKGLDGVSILNLMPKFLITPAAKASTAQTALTATGNNVKTTDQNWFAGRLTPVSDGELDASSTAVWYGACDPAIAPGVEYCHLEGAEGPQSIRKENEDAILGVQIYMFLDFAAKAVDFRTLYKSTGV